MVATIPIKILETEKMDNQIGFSVAFLINFYYKVMEPNKNKDKLNFRPLPPLPPLPPLNFQES